MNPSAISFFQVHTSPWLVLAGLAFFPRITLLFIGGPFGLLQWIGWGFAPHLLVAIMATMVYWNTNPLLCIISWFFAFAGTGTEGKVTHARVYARRQQ